MGCQTPSQLPDPFDRGEPGTLGRQEQQPQLRGMLSQEGVQKYSVMIAGIIKHHDHSTLPSPVAQQLSEEAQEGLGVEYGANASDEWPGAQIDRTEAGHGTARVSVQQKGIHVIWRHSHAAARPVLLEVAFVQPPQFRISPSSQTPQFFLPPRLSSGRPERPVGGACAAGSPSIEITFGIDVRPGPHHRGYADAPRAPDRPKAYRRAQSLAETCADRSGACATVLRRACGADLISPPHARHPVRPARNDGASAVPSCYLRQISPPPVGRTEPPLPATAHAADGRSRNPRSAGSLAGWQSASPPYPQSVACAPIFSQWKSCCDYTKMLHYL